MKPAAYRVEVDGIGSIMPLCRDKVEVEGLLARFAERVRNVVPLYAWNEWDEIRKAGDRVSREEAYKVMEMELNALHAENARLRMTLQAEGSDMMQSQQPVAWAVLLADGDRIYDVYAIEEEAKAISESVAGNHGIAPLYRSPDCPYVTGTVTRYCTLTPFTLSDAERAAIQTAMNAYGENNDDRECAMIEATLWGLLERTKCATEIREGRMVVRGWRYFSCESCGVKFRQPSRDCGSPSGEACEHCGDWLTPDGSQPDESLPCDERTGNLTIPARREKLE
jgi:hypothetical protein